MNIFLTGERGVGKSTILNKGIDELKIKPTGFRTLPFYTNGELHGYYMDGLTVESRANKQFISKRNGNSYRAIIETFENFGVNILRDSLNSSSDIILMDELGFFENNAFNFQRRVFDCLDSNKLVIGVLKKANSPFLNSIKERKDIILIEIDIDNREEKYQEFINAFLKVLDKTLSI